MSLSKSKDLESSDSLWVSLPTTSFFQPNSRYLSITTCFGYCLFSVTNPDVLISITVQKTGCNQPDSRLIQAHIQIGQHQIYINIF